MFEPQPVSYPCLHVTLSANLAEKATDVLLATGATGIETRDESTMIAATEGEIELIAWFDELSTAAIAGERVSAAFGSSSVTVSVERVEDPGWREAWREYFKPMRFGRRLWVAPPDEDPPRSAIEGAGAPTVIVRLLPSVAFGTGTHESTAMMLELVEELLQPGMNVLDVGCGSGILTVAAAKLDANVTYGIDVDPEAVIASGENALNNGVAGRCRFDGTPLDEVSGRYDLVLANLSAPVIVNLKQQLVDRVRLDGLLLWSGLLETDLDEVGSPPGSGLHRDMRRNGWAAQAWQVVHKLP